MKDQAAPGRAEGSWSPCLTMQVSRSSRRSTSVSSSAAGTGRLAGFSSASSTSGASATARVLPRRVKCSVWGVNTAQMNHGCGTGGWLDSPGRCPMVNVANDHPSHAPARLTHLSRCLSLEGTVFTRKRQNLLFLKNVFEALFFEKHHLHHTDANIHNIGICFPEEVLCPFS